MIRSLLDKFFVVFYVGIILGGLSLIGVYFFLSSGLPQLPEDLESINLSLPTEIYSADGERIQVLGERYPISLEDISPYFLKAIIAVEDAKFYRHKGLDHLGLLRAFYANIRSRRIVQGGSTITQQLSKNLFFSFERNLGRKIKELLIALQLEATFTKDQILEAYCNQVYFGSGAYGVEEATQVYFGKRAKDLTLIQAALLAGLPNSPNNANPFNNYERAVRRAKYVLGRMAQEGFISDEDKEEAFESDPALTELEVVSNPNQYFVNYVVAKLEKEYGKEFVHFGGLKVHTTLDSKYQFYAWKAAKSHLEALEEKMSPQAGFEPLQAALVAVENKTGAVRAMLGGRNYSHSQFNRAISHNRPPGSSFKPIVYMTALEALNFSPATVVRDEPVSIEIEGGDPWEPKNFSDNFSGDIILKKALMKSINVVSAKLVQKLTPERVIKTARQFGIHSPLGNNFSLSLGTSGVSPFEMASAYSVIANLGIYNEPYVIKEIEDFHGKQIYRNYYHGVQRFSQKTIYSLSDMLQGVIDGGTGYIVRKMGFRHPAAGKTGTTNEYKDAWFNGFTKDLSVSVWVGYDDNRSMVNLEEKGLTGAKAAAPIWVFFMQKALEGKNEVKFPVPTGIKFEIVDVQTGLLPGIEPVETMRVAVKEEVQLYPLQPEDNFVEGLSNPILLKQEESSRVSIP